MYVAELKQGHLEIKPPQCRNALKLSRTVCVNACFNLQRPRVRLVSLLSGGKRKCPCESCVGSTSYSGGRGIRKERAAVKQTSLLGYRGRIARLQSDVCTNPHH